MTSVDQFQGLLPASHCQSHATGVAFCTVDFRVAALE